MGSLSHRTLLQYLDSDDLVGLKSFLGTRQLQVDDRDEVSLGDFFQLSTVQFIKSDKIIHGI